VPTIGQTALPPLSPPPPPADAGSPVYHDPLPSHDALLDGPTSPPGWFGSVEVDFLKPHVTNRLSGKVFYDDGSFDPVRLPGAELDWVASPRFELGYRLSEGCGEIVMSYRFLTTDGHANLPNFDLFADVADALLKSRLDLNVFDLDYASREISLGTHWDLKWRAGVRVADLYYDSRAFGQITAQRASNQFVGAGPHAALDVWYHFDLPGLAAFARIDGAVMIGQERQRFDESFVFDDGSAFGSAASQSTTQVVPTLSAQLGLAWVPVGTRLRFSVGYEVEQWWNVGHVGDSRAELFDQGVFFRAEFCF
jgi:hypothetical protein